MIQMILAVVVAAAQASALTLWPADAPSTVYHVKFDGTFWNGAPKHYEHDFALSRGDAQTIHVQIGQDGSQPDQRFDATRSADGTLANATHNDQLSAYNTIARLVSSAGENLTKGAAWDTSVAIPLVDGTNAEVPVHAWIASAEGGNVVVQATGTHSGSMSYQGFTVPLDFTVRIASSFSNGGFSKLHYDVQEVVHAGPQTQTMNWSVSLGAK